MVTTIFKAFLINDPVQVENNNSSSMHVRLRVSAKLSAKDAESGYPKSSIFDCSVWGKQAELALSSLRKGSNILIYANVYDITTNTSNDKTYVNISLNVTSFEFLDTREANTAQTNQSVQGAQITQPAQTMAPPQSAMVTAPITPTQAANNPMVAGSFTAPQQPPMWGSPQMDAIAPVSCITHNTINKPSGNIPSTTMTMGVTANSQDGMFANLF